MTKYGAIIHVNCDQDNIGLEKQRDSEDTVINGDKDLADLHEVKIAINSMSGKPIPAGTQLLASSDQADYIRLFDKLAIGAKMILGREPSPPPVTDGAVVYYAMELEAGTTEVILGLEATRFPSEHFDGLVTIDFQLIMPMGAKVELKSATFRVAPWIMFNHADVTEKVYVVNFTGYIGSYQFKNDQFITDLVAAIDNAAPVEIIQQSSAANESWIQDLMELGYTSIPAAGGEVSSMGVALRPQLLRDNEEGEPTDFVREHLLKADYGFYQAIDPAAATVVANASGMPPDGFGNVECSPPCEVNGVQYPFGRIVYGNGDQTPAELESFLIAQQVQAPLEVDVDWLRVAHVDEIVSFLPLASGGFKVAMPSPMLALNLLQAHYTQLPAGDPGLLFADFWVSDAWVEARQEKDGFSYEVALNKQQEIFRQDHKPFSLIDIFQGSSEFPASESEKFRTIQQAIDDKLTQEIWPVVRDGLGLTDDDVIRLPVLFKEPSGFDTYMAHTPDVVNMLVVTKSNKQLQLVMPKPHAPHSGQGCIFEQHITDTLTTALNISPTAVQFVDNFLSYHRSLGEIHCGTNSLRTMSKQKWWE